MKPLADAAHCNPALQEALTRIYGLHRKEMDFRLEAGPYRDLLIKLGNPQNRLPPVIHVAGTNGKGSTIAMMRALAEHYGLTVHVYTSPHLFRFNERLRVAGQLISDEDLLKGIEYINEINQDAPVTFFEFTSALMFHIFASTRADLCLIETGMGGRLDCTNVVDKPDLCVLTSISYDHMEFLGTDIKDIAREKCGIIKPNTKVVVARQPYADAVMPVIQDTIERQNAALVPCASPHDIPASIPLKGAHQRDNAGAALAAMRVLYPDIRWPDDLDVHWPGRFQRLQHDHIDFMYDGAHNEDSLRTLGDTLRSEFPDRAIIIALCMQDGKDPAMVKKAFKDLNARYVTVDLPAGRRPQTASDLSLSLKSVGISVDKEFTTVQQAVDYTVENYAGCVLVLTGSLYAAQLIPETYWPILDL